MPPRQRAARSDSDRRSVAETRPAVKKPALPGNRIDCRRPQRPPARGQSVDRTNHQFRLAARPSGLPEDSDWSYAEESVPEPGEGEVLVQVLYISLDPAMRGWMNEARTYIAPVEIGDVLGALGAGRGLPS